MKREMTPSIYATILPPGQPPESDCSDFLWADLDHIYPQIAADCRARAVRYASEHDGAGLDPFCGREWLAESYQEMIDAITYLRLEAIRLRPNLAEAGFPAAKRLLHVHQMEASMVRLTQWCLSVLQEEEL